MEKKGKNKSLQLESKIREQVESIREQLSND